MTAELTPCPRCGYENRARAYRCSLCGAPFVKGSEGVLLAAKTVSHIRRGEREDGLPVLSEFKRRDFAAEISSNKAKSWLLLGLLTCILMIIGIYAGNQWGFPLLGGLAALLLAGIIALWSYFAGASTILRMSQANKANPDSEGRLINTVDEMRIAAGVPMPQVYVIDSSALNAFATGRDPDHAVVAVTRGLLGKLKREELQAVVAHEMSHIRNFDIRYMMLVAALVGAIVLIADVFRRSLWFGGGRGRSRRSVGGGRGAGQAQAIIAIVGLVFILLAPLFATLVQMSISRRREFLADASAVELTRNPLALASALESIDNTVEREPLPGASKATQHLYISNPLRSFGMRSSALFSTHPPMEARIRVLRAMV